MKHLPDLLTLLYRRPLFHMYVHLSICLSTFMSKFDIYVKVSILINYKTQQPSNLAWNTSLTSRLYDIGAHFSIRLSVRPSVCPSVNSSVMSKFDIYVKVSILINYKTKQPSNLVWNISLTSWLCDIDARFAICLSVRPSVCYNNHHTLHDTSPWPPDLAGMLTQWPWPIFCAPLTLTQFTLTFQIFSTIRRTTTKPCIVLLLDVLTWQVPWPGDLDLYFALQWLWHILFDISSTIRPTTIKPWKVLLLNVLTWQIPWPGDLDLYFGCSDFDIIYVNVLDLLKFKTSSHQNLA